MAATSTTLLRAWLNERVEPAAFEWLDGRIAVVRGGDVRQLYLVFGMVPRRTGKADLALSKVEQLKAEDVRPGWDVSTWSVDHAARTLLVLSFPSADAMKYSKTLDRLFDAGEVSELVALYQSLPLLPHQETHVLRAAEGLRTNIKPVFAAIAHRNPYPAERFTDAQWNQMVLKCLFVDLPLWPIVGLDERANVPLMRMLCDYAHERWAAGRTVSPELWRCVGPVADDAAIEDLAKVLRDGSDAERQGAALALAMNNNLRAKELLDGDQELSREVSSGRISWNSISTS